MAVQKGAGKSGRCASSWLKAMSPCLQTQHCLVHHELVLGGFVSFHKVIPMSERGPVSSVSCCGVLGPELLVLAVWFPSCFPSGSAPYNLTHSFTASPFLCPREQGLLVPSRVEGAPICVGKPCCQGHHHKGAHVPACPLHKQSRHSFNKSDDGEKRIHCSWATIHPQCDRANFTDLSECVLIAGASHPLLFPDPFLPCCLVAAIVTVIRRVSAIGLFHRVLLVWALGIKAS